MRKQMSFVAMVAIFLMAAFNVLSQEQSPAPVFQEGDFWHFRATEKHFSVSRSNPIDGIYELAYSRGRVRISLLTDGQKEAADSSATGPLLALLGQNTIVQDLKFPLFVGQKWTYQYETAAIGARQKLRHTAEITVTGIEEVNTPAGSFKAFKLEKDDRWGSGLYWLTTYYYSPETKSVVKSLLDSTSGKGAGVKREIELIKFGSGR